MNIPRDDSLPEIRRAFYSTPPGIKRYGFDLSSAELWVTASVTQDPLLTSTLIEGRNLHVETMLAVFGGEPDKTRREYTLSKNVNFGIEYGAGLDQITVFAAKAGYSPREARRVAKRMRDGHKEAYAVQHRVAKFLAAHAERVGKIPMYGKNDRYRHFWSPGKRVHSYTALNALVQGGVAEFMKDTMLALDHTWARDMLVLQVHDELAFDAPDEPGMEQRLHRLLTRIANDINPFRYPLTWAAKTWEHDLDPD
jgi:DNA polymerase I-like protein with 3'-5' exonuclease and polymerase domains